MHLTVLETTKDPWRVILAISGFGAARLLVARHASLLPKRGEHVLEGAEGTPTRPRARVRVVVAAQAVAPAAEKDGALLRQARAACDAVAASLALQVVRRYREEPSPLVRDSVRGWRTGHLDRVLGGDFDLFS